MALRPGRATRKIERPYTRVSRRKPKQSYVVGVPFPKIHQFEMGTKGNYNTTLDLIAERAVQIRHNSLEAARIVTTNYLTKKLGLNFFLKILIFPHHVIREKPIATGAGADRYSQGMRKSFGKPSALAAQIKEGQMLMKLFVNKEGEKVGREALKKAGLKLPTPVKIVVEE
jgi:large subunit ribosomal protein L10e